MKKARRGGGSNMNPVFSLIERDGAARSVHMPNVRVENLGAVLENHASGKSDLMTDEAGAFVQLGWNFRSHQTVNHSKDEYVRREGTRIITTNGVEGFFSILKRGVYGVYQHVSEAHLHRYLYEFDFRYSNREKLGVNDVARASRALAGAKGRRLTYETTLFNGR
jgi:hypothetical protein